MAVNETDITMLIAQPVLFFISAIIIWSVQSWFVLYFARRYVYPQFYRSKVTSWFFAEASIILHEASHLITAIFTGSTIDLRKSYVSPTAGRITTARSESIGGWLSNVFAAIAPSFFPPLLFAILFFVLTQQPVSLGNMFSYQNTPEELQGAFYTGIDLIGQNLYSMLVYASEPSVFVIVLAYLLIICTIAAGPSEGDWMSTFELFISPVPAISLLVVFFFLSIVFAQFNIGFLIPFTVILLFNLSIVIVGICLAFLFALWLRIIYERGIAVGAAILLLIGVAYFLLGSAI